MKMLLVVLPLLMPSNGGSLGIGIDVLPEAYGFAARRVGFSADLRLVSCTESRCLWELGDGVQIAADRAKESLEIYRIEATLDRASVDAVVSASRYEQACLAIVALIERGASSAEVRVTSKVISSGAALEPLAVDNLEGGTIRLYRDPAPGHDDKGSIAKRCGAFAS